MPNLFEQSLLAGLNYEDRVPQSTVTRDLTRLAGFPLYQPRPQVSNMHRRFRRSLLGAPGGKRAPDVTPPMPDLHNPRYANLSSTEHGPKRRPNSASAAGSVALPVYVPGHHGWRSPAIATRGNNSRERRRASRAGRQAAVSPHSSLIRPLSVRLAHNRLLVREYNQVHAENMSRRAPRVATRAYGGSSNLLGGGVGSFALKRFAPAPTTVEVKYFDLTVAALTGAYDVVNPNTLAVDLSIITMGANQSQRIGTDLHFKQLTLSYQPRMSVAGTPTDPDYAHWRLTIFLWKPNTASAPKWGDVFQLISTGSDAKAKSLQTAFAMYNSRTADNYRILSDKTGTLTGKIATAATVGGTIAPIVKIAVPLNGTCKLLASDGVQGSGKVYMFFTAVNHVTAASVPVCDVSSRLWYTDA